MKKAILFLLFIFHLSLITSDAKVVKVLAIGNSFSQDAIEQYLYELARAQGDSLVIGNAYIGGCSIDRHYTNLVKDSALYTYRKVVGGVRSERKKWTLKQIIRDEQWDVISLQQASQLSGVFDSYKNLPAFKRLVESYVTNLHVEFVWHMTWAYAEDFKSSRFQPYDYKQRQMYSDIVSTMLSVMPAISNPRIVPTGTAVQLVRYRLGDILNRDGMHLSYTLGRYTAACTWCEFLTGRIVDGNSYYPATINETEAQICQEEAHEAVFMSQRGRFAVF